MLSLVVSAGALLAAPSVVKVDRAGPIATLEEGLRSAKALENPVVVELAPGTYPVTESIRLEAEDSGVTIRGGGKARLVGGRFLRKWSVSHDPRLAASARGKVLEADLGSLDPGKLMRRGFGLPRQVAALELFQDGEPMNAASWPNQGEWLRIESTPAVDQMAIDTDQPSQWDRSQEIWTFGYWQFDWAESYEPVKSIEGRTVTLVGKPGTYEAKAGRRFRFLNALEALDTPGEYVVDRKLGKAFLWPKKPIGAEGVLASELSGPVFRIEGANRVKLDGLGLEGGRDGGISVKGGSAVQVVRCSIRNFGTYGVSLENAPRSLVKDCELSGLGEFGISLAGGDRKTLTRAGMAAEGNHIWSYSRWCRTYQPAVLISGVGNRISGNWIHDAPHQAILLSGNDHLIEYNRIERMCTETGDAGAIYMGRNPTMRGNVIRYNLLREMGPKVSTEGNYTGVMGVYLDDCWCGTTVYGNVFEMSGTGIMIGGGRDNVVENNVFLGCQPAIHFDARGIGWAKDFFKQSTEWGMYDRFREVPADRPPYTSRYPGLATYLADEPAFPKGNRIVRNIAAGGQWLTLLDGLKENDFVNESNVVETGALNLDQALLRKPPGFQAIPLHKIAKVRK
ncbi:MAG TPA: right-handed parallel beta-helix repeat-containing protein [Fimbriimonas sp.]